MKLLWKLAPAIIASTFLYLSVSKILFSQGVPKVAPPLPNNYIGRIGSADMRLLAPQELRTAAEMMSFDNKQYEKARNVISDYYSSHSDSKFAYIALCELDPAFRESEYYRLRYDTSTSTLIRFKRATACYFHSFVIIAIAPGKGRTSELTTNLDALSDKNNGALSIAEKLWTDEPEMFNGIFLASIHRTFGLSDPAPHDFLCDLIRVSAGPKSAKQYQDAEGSGWKNPIPATTGIDRVRAGFLVATLSNDISRLSEGTLGKHSNEIVDRKGNVKEVYSQRDKEWVFVQAGTELHFIGEWRRALRHQFKFP